MKKRKQILYKKKKIEIKYSVHPAPRCLVIDSIFRRRETLPRHPCWIPFLPTPLFSASAPSTRRVFLQPEVGDLQSLLLHGVRAAVPGLL